MPPPGGRGPRGGSGAFGADDRWQSGRMPAGAVCWLAREQIVASFCWVFCCAGLCNSRRLQYPGPHIPTSPHCGVLLYRPHARPAWHAWRRTHDASGQPPWRRGGRPVGARQAAAAHAWHAAGWWAGVAAWGLCRSLRLQLRCSWFACPSFFVLRGCPTLCRTRTPCRRVVMTAGVAPRPACAQCLAARCRSCTRPSRHTR